MSHFLTIVLIPKDAPDIESAVASLLAPFDEAIEVEPYLTECWCVGSVARRVGREAADRAAGTLDDLRLSYWKLPDGDRPAWDTWVAGWTAVADRTEQAHPLYQKAEPDCEDCHGSGQRPTTYNPDSQWDWWTIGGRWHGRLGPDNVLPTPDAVAHSTLPFAVLTPDGVWHDKGRMGWWGIVMDPKDDDAWDHQALELLKAYPDTLAVVCDLHI